jgi:hypothetical protein
VCHNLGLQGLLTVDVLGIDVLELDVCALSKKEIPTKRAEIP